MLKSLLIPMSCHDLQLSNKRPHQYEEVVMQESLPGVLRIKLLISIKKNGPLITSNKNCSAL